MRTIIFPFPSEFEQELESRKWRDGGSEVIVLKSYPLNMNTRKPEDFDFKEFVKLLIGKAGREDSTRLVFSMSGDKERIGEISGEMPCRLEIILKDGFNADKVLLHDGKGFVK